MSPLSPELIQEAAPRVATFRRRVAEVDTAQWIRRGLPRVNGLPPVDVLARQAVDLRDDLRRYLRAQEARFVEYVRTHPPDLRPVDAGALAALPPQAVLTYHMWLDELVRSTEEADRDDLARILRRHLREALGTGGEAARATTGALPPGFGHLAQKEAAALLRTGPAKDAFDPGAQAFRKALADRAHQQAIQGAVLRDGAGRPVAAATFSTRGPALTIRNLGGLEPVVPGAGLHMLRELAGLAAAKGKGLQMITLAGSEPVLRELGFTQEADGRFTLSADSALALAQSAPGPSAAWTRAGWLEGPEATFEERLGPDREWLLAQQQVPVRKAAGPEAYATAVLMGTDGTLWAVAKYLMNAGARDLVVVSLWLNPGAPPTAARRMMRKMAEIAAKAHRGLTMTTAATAGTGLAARLGMARVADGYGFTAQQAATFASGLTQGMSFAGCVSWELAVAGATEYLENIIIPGVVDTVSATTHKQLVDTLVKGLAAGEGTNDLIARIRALDETAFGLVRAERIARTEAITANRAGAYQIALGSGASKKQWVSRLMPNTREWHREAHQQLVPIAEPFVVANRKGELEHLKFPGDRSLGAGPDNTIQCVCSALYLKPGVSDDAAYEQYGTAGTTAAPGPVVVIAPEPVRKATVITLEELREFVTKDKGWAPGPNAGWRRKDEPDGDRPKWKPVMRPEDARKWVEGSKITDTVVHVTGKEHVDGIAAIGFNTDPVSPEWTLFGPGAYFGTDAPTVEFYNWKGDEMVSCKVRVENPLEVTFRQGDDYSRLGLSESYPDVARARSFLLDAAGYARSDPGVGDAIYTTNGYDMTKLLKAKGFDAVIIHDEGQVSDPPGGSQLLVFAKEQVVTIATSADDLSTTVPDEAWLRPGKGDESRQTVDQAIREAFAKNKGWAPGPNAGWRRLDDRPTGPDLPMCQPPNLKDFTYAAGPTGWERLDRAVAGAVKGGEGEEDPIDTLESGGMGEVGEYWEKDFKALVQERLYRRLEDDDAFRRMVAKRMGLDPDQVGPESMKTTVRELVDTWAKTSGDSQVESLLVQEAARQEFGLTGARSKDLAAMAEATAADEAQGIKVPGGWTPEKHERYTATLESPQFDGYRSFVRAQYEETQEFLERAGIDEVLVYRGGGVPADTVPDAFPDDEHYVAGYVHLRQNPLTSWSTDTATASEFQVAHLESQAPATFATVVPRGRILSTPATGVGCLREAEVVVLGGETPAFMIAGRDGTWRNFDEEVEAYEAKTLGPHRFWPQTIPEGAGDDERK